MRFDVDVGRIAVPAKALAYTMTIEEDEGNDYETDEHGNVASSIIMERIRLHCGRLGSRSGEESERDRLSPIQHHLLAPSGEKLLFSLNCVRKLTTKQNDDCRSV